MISGLDSILLSGSYTLPLVEGGKGISVSNGQSAGAWAKQGGVGTLSAVNADYYDEQGNYIKQAYQGKTRKERHLELIKHAIKGGVAQCRIARDISGENGKIHINILWEMGGAEVILREVLKQASHLVNGVTCGAGMPYRLASICAEFKLFYYPIVSSARAFRALWNRAYHKFSQWLGGVVYEDPWLAGGHNGLSNKENPLYREEPYGRVKALRKEMKGFGLGHVPIIIAGGVWNLSEWSHFLEDPDLHPLAFQFGTRPLLTKESPISDQWKEKLRTLKEGDVSLMKFSPTGFYSSALKNHFLKNLEDRSHRQVPYQEKTDDVFAFPFIVEKRRQRTVFLTQEDMVKVSSWVDQGFSFPMKTPDHTLIFVTESEAEEILEDQIACMGCLSACRFSNWSQKEPWNTGVLKDPRSFCIQKTLQAVAHGADVENELVFSGHNAYRFAQDPFYDHGFTPTVKQLIERILEGR